MRRSQFTDQEIIHLLWEASAGVPVAEICRTSQVSLRTFYRWRQRFGGLTPQAVQQMQDLKAENGRLRALVSSLTGRLQGTEDDRSKVALYPRSPAYSERGSTNSTPRLLSARPREGVTLGRFAGVRISR
jgi:putative transposase